MNGKGSGNGSEERLEDIREMVDDGEKDLGEMVKNFLERMGDFVEEVMNEGVWTMRKGMNNLKDWGNDRGYVGRKVIE